MRGIPIAAVLSILLLAGAGAGSAEAAVDPLRSVQWALDAIHLGDLGRRTPQPVPDGAGVVTVVARATAVGRRVLRSSRSRAAVVEAGLDGAPGARRALTLRAR